MVSLRPATVCGRSVESWPPGARDLTLPHVGGCLPAGILPFGLAPPSRRSDWYAHVRGRTRPARVEPDLSAVTLHHDPPRDVEPETSSLADIFRREERFEDVLAGLAGDPLAGVGDVDEDVGLRPHDLVIRGVPLAQVPGHR